MQRPTYDAVRAMFRADPPSPQQLDGLTSLLPGELRPPPDRMLTTAEAAQRLGVCRRQVQRWASAGLLPARKYGRRCVRFRESDIVRFMARED